MPGQRLVLVGFGAGLTWASALVQWGPSVEEARAVLYRRIWRWLLYHWADLRSRLRLNGRGPCRGISAWPSTHPPLAVATSGPGCPFRRPIQGARSDWDANFSACLHV